MLIGFNGVLFRFVICLFIFLVFPVENTDDASYLVVFWAIFKLGMIGSFSDV